MEKRAYHLSRAQYCIPARTSENIGIAELVDTVAGSETGALLAAALLLPGSTTTAKYSAEDVSAWFVSTIGFYNLWKYPIDAILFCALVWAIIFGLLGYRITDRMFESYEFGSILQHFHEIIAYRKKMNKYPRKYDDGTLNSKIVQITNEINEKKGSIRGDIDSLLKELKNPNIDGTQITECEEKLH